MDLSTPIAAANEEPLQPDAEGDAPSKPRGRPKKPKPEPKPCQRSFEAIAAALVKIAAIKGPLWRNAKDRVRSDADRNPALSPSATRVLGFLLEHINRKVGYDWHGAETIAADRDMSVRSVERAFQELISSGMIARRWEIARGSKSSKRWKTTIPALEDAAAALCGPNDAKDPPGKYERTRQEKAKDPTNKDEGPAKIVGEGPDKFVGQTLEETNLGNSTPPLTPRKRGARARDDLLQEVRSARPDSARAMDKLFTPLLVRIRFDAPDKAAALGALVEVADKQSDEVLEETLQLLTTPGGEQYRSYDVRPTNIEVAMKAAIAAVNGREVLRNGKLLWRGTPEFAAAVARVAETNPAQADWLRSREWVPRAEFARYDGRAFGMARDHGAIEAEGR